MTTDQRTMKAGTKVAIGAPENPLPAATVDQVRGLLAGIDDVVEAHVPQCYMEGVFDPPAQVLVVVLASGADLEAVATRIGEGLSGILASGEHLDMWPIRENDPVLTPIRQAKCVVKGPAGKPWWKLW